MLLTFFITKNSTPTPLVKTHFMYNLCTSYNYSDWLWLRAPPGQAHHIWPKLSIYLGEGAWFLKLNALEVRILSLAAEQVTKPTQKRISKESQIWKMNKVFILVRDYLIIWISMQECELNKKFGTMISQFIFFYCVFRF